MSADDLRGAILDLHRRAYVTAGDETWERNPVCAECGQAYPCPTAALATAPPEVGETPDADAAAAVAQLQDLLGCVWLYVSWYYVTQQLTTRQKDLWADAVEEWSGRLPADEPGEEPTRPLRWWRSGEPMRGRYCCPAVYVCHGELECARHGGFDVCCDTPDAHQPVEPVRAVVARIRDGVLRTHAAITDLRYLSAVARDDRLTEAETLALVSVYREFRH